MVVGESTGGGGGWEGIFLGGGRMIEFSAGGGGGGLLRFCQVVKCLWKYMLILPCSILLIMLPCCDFTVPNINS